MIDQELDRFKTDIDLRSFATSCGYQLDRRASWRGSAVMRHPVSHDKIIIKLDIDGHWTFYSVRDDRDHGSIIDFLQFRRGLNLGDVRKELRPWLNQSYSSPPVFPAMPKTEKDLIKVESSFASMRDASDGHPYLERRRGLSASTLTQERFAKRIRIDGRGNAVFPHFEAGALTGYELRNVNFKGFSSSGRKSLWESNVRPDDRRIIFCESAIDALSYAELFPDDHTRYASIAGKLNPRQAELIRAAAARMPYGSEAVAAMDADEDGRTLAGIVKRAVELTGRVDLQFRIHEPNGFKDFNDQLRAQRPATNASHIATAELG